MGCSTAKSRERSRANSLTHTHHTHTRVGEHTHCSGHGYEVQGLPRGLPPRGYHQDPSNLDTAQMHVDSGMDEGKFEAEVRTRLSQVKKDQLEYFSIEEAAWVIHRFVSGDFQNLHTIPPDTATTTGSS